jgi:hypothetical protein
MADLTLVPPTNGNGNGNVTGLLPPSPAPLSPPPKPRTQIKLSKRDSAVAALHRIGIDEETIASRLHITTLAVQKSLLKWYKQQMEGSTELVQIRVNEMALANLELVNALIRDGLTATRAIKNDKDEIIGSEPDFAMRKSMAALLKEWTQAVIPKGPLISQNINQNNQQNNFNSVKGHNMEGRLRAIREKNGLRNDDVDDANADDNTIDAEFEDDDNDTEGDELDEVVELGEGDEGDAENSTQGS